MHERKEKSIEELHEILELDPFNVRLHNRLEKLWTKIEDQEQELYQNSTIEYQNNFRDHNWWKRAGSKIQEGKPVPKYT